MSSLHAQQNGSETAARGEARELTVQPISLRLPDAVRLTGLSRSTLYELMRSGDIEHLKVGRATLIPYRSLQSFVEQRSKAGTRSPKEAQRGPERDR
ncbi:MAG: DNA-binding protein [Alphaproteobacteria bacterium]|nr:DNA-binding protein [Alphaproteobacteria bacterium]